MHDLVTLQQGDFRELCLELEPDSVDLVYTDPPYGRKTLHLYPELLLSSARVMRPGAVLVAIVPQYAIPLVGEWTEPSGLRWRWLCFMDQNAGPHPRLCNAAHNIEVTSKCLGWWYKPGGPPDYSSVRDSFINDPKSKPQHEWEQSLTWAEYGLRYFCPDGGLVLDPMVGTGTVLEACLRRGVRGIGFDLDDVKLDIARRRLDAVAAELQEATT